MINHKDNLNRINTMKSQLVKTKKTMFTRKDFMQHTSASRYYFNQALKAGLIVDTGNTFANKQGAPMAYTLAKAFSSHVPLGDKYSLSQEDVDTLLRVKETKLTKLNGSINVMKSQISKIEKEKELLKKIELV